MASSTSIIVRVELTKEKISFGEVALDIGLAGGDLIATDVIHSGKDTTTRDITVNLPDAGNLKVIDTIRSLPGVDVINVSDRTFLVHLGGKIEIQPKMPIKNRDDLSLVYTPGVARVCMAINDDNNKAFTLTMKRNTVAVVSDGTAVLGLEDIGPHAAMPFIRNL